MSSKTKEIPHEYDLANMQGVRGKYAKAYKAGYSVRIFDGEKLLSDEFFAAIDPEVRKHFPDSMSINRALRKLIPASKKQTPTI